MSAPRFFVSESLSGGASVTVGEEAAHHMRVLRLAPGSAVTLIDGQGSGATGTLRTLARRSATVDVLDVRESPPLSPVHLLLPVGDRDRMLWLAEKAAEFGIASWRPVLWKRSRSVSPRGEGPTFQGRVRARMIAALEQSGNAWLPMIYPDATIEHAVAALAEGARVLCDAGGHAIATQLVPAPGAVTIAVGPEGGLEAGEREALITAGFVAASLGPTTLRFETAAIAAIAHARAALTRTETTE
ncbi:MAG TPA: RsmE family RNA methyltransferase [Gemmatimonadaceae bacterium]|nr:RsmE family RNA methyltransferase [Gemmatimonadaceae bacterium]